MSGKHTPGPWRVNTCRMGDKLMGWHIAADEHGSSLPVCLSDKYSEYRDQDEEIRNAFLISAAPDMLEALKGVLLVADRQTDEFDAARAAIAKAEGRKS